MPDHHAEISPPIRQAAPAALRAVLQLLKTWDLSDKEKAELLGLTDQDLAAYIGGDVPGELTSSDLVLRVSYLLGIAKALDILISDTEPQSHWINNRSDATPFDGQTPKHYLLANGLSGLHKTREYLDGMLNGDFA